MQDYIQLLFGPVTEEQTGLLIAALSDAGFEGFEEGEQTLKAFAPADHFNENAVNEIAQHIGIGFSTTRVEETNWNAVWESNFQPVIVDDFAAVRASFHEPIQGVKYEIIITPKMSFGTGHHATTYMMIQQMQSIDFTGKTVFDFGTGTGVLAILAEKLGAEKVIAVDNDQWSIDNAQENIQENHCSRIELQKADTARQQGQFDIILANINKNVILDNLSLLAAELSPNGLVLLSGLLREDQADILEAASRQGLLLQQSTERSNWLFLKLSSR